MKTKLNEIRKEAENIIISVLNEAGVKKLDIAELEISGLDSAPVLQDSFTNEERTVTLNEIEITKRGLLFEGSSSWEDLYLELDEVYTDILVDIATWLQANEAEIIELVSENEDI